MRRRRDPRVEVPDDDQPQAQRSGGAKLLDGVLQIMSEAPPYDPKLIRAKAKQDRAARAEALLNGAPVPAASGVVHHVVDDEPRWTVPATCPECGARVDQSTAAFAEHPACTYCAKPLPCQPAYTQDY